ncbi:MAG: invasion associated locus B family protein [Paracoccaceae bacterium]
MTGNRFRRLFAALALSVVASAPAAAQVGEPADWSRLCEDGRCIVSARLLPPLGGSRFATVAIAFDEGGGSPALNLSTPLGIAVPPGVRLVIDGETALDAPVEVCLPDGCRAALTLSEEQAEALAAAETLEVRYFEASTGRQLAAELSTRGLARRLFEYAP